MKVKQIRLDNDSVPDRVTVELSLEEAAFIAKVCGDISVASANEQYPEFSRTHPHSSLYRGLSEDLFNRFFDDGVAEAVRMIRGRA